MAEPNLLRLETLADGAAVELFEAALARALENIDDPNTDPEQVRKIVLTVTLRPDSKRRDLKIGIQCTQKLAAMVPVTTTAFVGRNAGKLAAVEAFSQESLFPSPNSRPTPVASEA